MQPRSDRAPPLREPASRACARFPWSYLAGVLFLLLAAAPLQAQSIQGVLREQGTGIPISTAVIILLDEHGEQVAGTLSRADGRFTIQARRTGSYRLRAERIGYRSTISPVLEVGAAGVPDYRLEAETQPVDLGIEISASSRRQCVLHPQEGLALHAVWEEARKALTAAALTRQERWLRFEVERYQRELDPTTLHVRRDSRRTLAGLADNPFQSVALERLIEHGFVESFGDSIVWHAPDADVLLAREFHDTHCFRLREGGGEQQGLIGLAFEPVRGRRVPEVTGVLWLDRRTAELRFMEYDYTNLPWQVPSRHLGGRVEFQRLPTGAWIVERWWIRSPGIRLRQEERVRPGEWSLTQRTPYVLGAILEEGGEVRSFEVAGAARRAPGRTSLAGAVFDSTRATPLPGATVYLSGTQYSAVTDADGRFRLDDLPLGEFSLGFSHPAWDSLGVVPPAQRVSLHADSEATADLALPPMERILDEACADVPTRFKGAVLVGYVRDASSGDPVVNARVEASWTRHQGRGRGVQTEDLEAIGTTDAAGFYRLCGIPTGTPVEVRAVYGRHFTGRSTLRFDGPGLGRRDLDMPTR
jgi:hypothetical protein